MQQSHAPGAPEEDREAEVTDEDIYDQLYLIQTTMTISTVDVDSNITGTTCHALLDHTDKVTEQTPSPRQQRGNEPE